MGAQNGRSPNSKVWIIKSVKGYVSQYTRQNSIKNSDFVALKCLKCPSEHLGPRSSQLLEDTIRRFRIIWDQNLQFFSRYVNSLNVIYTIFTMITRIFTLHEFRTLCLNKMHAASKIRHLWLTSYKSIYVPQQTLDFVT